MKVVSHSLIAALAVTGVCVAAPAVWSQNALRPNLSLQEPAGNQVPTATSPDPMAPTPPPAVSAPAEPMNAQPTTPAAAAQSTMSGAPQQWQATVSTSLAGQAPLSTQVSFCVADGDPVKAAEKALGHTCGDSDFTMSGNTLSWKGTCKAAKGSGQLTFSDDRRSFTGDVNAVRSGLPTQVHVDGKAIGGC